MGHGARLGTQAQERQVDVAEEAAVAGLLASGVSVIVDDTNLPPETLDTWRQIADAADAPLEVVDLRDVDVEVCIARDADRRAKGEPDVGAEVIRAMHQSQRRVL